MPNRETEQAVATFFHLNRALAKKRGDAADNPVYRAFVHRARMVEAERRFCEKLARWDWGRQWG